MKKFVAAVMASLMMVSSAAAECACAADVDVKMAACQMSGLAEKADAEIIARFAVGDAVECGAARLALLNVLLKDAEGVRAAVGQQRYEALVKWVAHCCCEGEKAGHQQEAKVQHEHRGGTHENGGRCVGCGAVYQAHKIEWRDINNDQHQEQCGCGWIGAKANHVVGEKLGVEDGMTRFSCGVCGAVHYWYLYSGAWCDACGRPVSDCCNNCQCSGCAG